MAMDFLEQQVTSPDNLKNVVYFFYWALLFAQCSPAPHTVAATDTALRLDNGVLYFKDAPFNGALVAYHTNGRLKSKANYVDGRKNGQEKHWHLKGSLAIQRSYKQGFKVGVHKGWYGDGQPRFEYHFDQEGRYHGIHKEWYRTGQMAVHFNFTHGREQGHQRLWQKDGSIKANYKTLNGERYGLIGLKKCNTLTANSTILK